MQIWIANFKKIYLFPKLNKQVGGSEKKILLDQSVKTFYKPCPISKFIDEKRKEPCYMIERIKLELERHKFDRVVISRARDEIYRLIYIYIYTRSPPFRSNGLRHFRHLLPVPSVRRKGPSKRERERAWSSNLSR